MYVLLLRTPLLGLLRRSVLVEALAALSNVFLLWEEVIKDGDLFTGFSVFFVLASWWFLDSKSDDANLESDFGLRAAAGSTDGPTVGAVSLWVAVAADVFAPATGCWSTSPLVTLA